MDSSGSPLLKLPLDGLHRSLGAKFAPFSGYDMPVQYEGLIAEHNWTRTHAGLFDVSHMGPCFLSLNEGMGGGDDAHKRVAAIVEKLVPADIQGLKPGQIRYTVLLNESGGVLDDLMIARPLAPIRQGALYIVVNAGMKEHDFRLLTHAAGGEAKLHRADDQVLLALQGPKAATVAARLAPELAQLKFMHTWRGLILSEDCLVARSGYTGEDGYELLVTPSVAEKVAQFLLDQPEVKPIGLGAR
ncbi:MAG: glycine cleavage system protein T, partial [Pseudomonadota bacterium]